MTVWSKTDNSSRFGVVLYNFKKKGDQHLLNVNIGDTVVILEQSTDWYYGYLTRNKSQSGIFPKSYVHIKEAHTTGSLETVVAKEPPIAQEITSVVREWNLYWKTLFLENDPDFSVVQDMMQSLVVWRKEILSRKMTQSQMKELKQKVSSKIDNGNALLGLDLVVRDDEGNVLNPETASVIKIYREHVEASDRLKQEKSAPDVVQKTKGVCQTINLYVMLRNFVCRVDDAEILVNLYDGKEMKYICENFIVRWEKERLAKDPDLLNNTRVVFTDLDAKDRKREKVFLVFQIIRVGVMDHKDAEDKKQTRGLRRSFGAAAMDITGFLNGSENAGDDFQHFIPFLQCGEKDFMENGVRKAVDGRNINHKGQGLWVSLKLLLGDMKQVSVYRTIGPLVKFQIREDFPHLVQPSTPVVRKMGFPEVIMPGDVRNDIYVLLCEGEFNRGSKTADKNVEVTMLVCNKRGEVIPNVINVGCGGGEGVSEYKTMIYYHEDKPKWEEIVKVTLSTETEFKGIHFKFLFKHKSRNESKDKNEKPFAMAFVKLLNKNGTTLTDAEHDLCLYKESGGNHSHGAHKKKSGAMIDYGNKSKQIDKKDDKHFHAYLDLPSTTRELESPDVGGSGKFSNSVMTGTHSKIPKISFFSGPYSLSFKDSFKISTFVCSTKLTHNVDLLGLLKWQEILNDTTSLKKHLENLMKVQGEEIVKFLQDLLDSLFYILMQNMISDLYDNLVFDALVYIIGLVADSRYYQFRPILDAYIQSFSITTAYNKLMSILKEYVNNANEDTEHEPSFRQAMKSLEYIFKFIVRSRELFAMLNENKGKQQFEIMLKQLIQSIGGMMLYMSDRTIRAQGYALRNMPATISDILRVFNAVELSHLFVEFLNYVPKNRLRIQKIKCIEDLVQTDLFRLPECRDILLPTMLKQIHDMMESQDDRIPCIKVLSNIMDALFSPQKKIYHDKDIHCIMEYILRTVIQTTIKTHDGECVAVLLSILRQMTESHYNAYINKFIMLSDMEDFLLEIMMLFQNLINSSVFQTDWMEMILLQNSVILRALRFFAHTINQKFSNPFQHQLWSNFFHCAISFLTQDHLQLENFSTSKRNKIVARYKDMRRETGFEIRSLWFSLGSNKISFIPELVAQLLEMTLIPEIELRKATIPIFFDMMICEAKARGSFKQFENEMISQMDVLVEGGRGDEQYMLLFKDILSQACSGMDKMRESGMLFVETVTKMLQRLLEYRHIIQDEIKDHRMSCIVNLLDFYNSIGRQEMYIRYLHKLCNMHLECDNYTEAAHTLMLNTKLLEWSDERLSAILVSERFPEARTHRELKEMLFHHIIQYLEKGKMWEKGIELCKELANLYENELFDYEKLSWTLKRQAELYQCIIREMRPDPEYFRVGYFGKGFPSFLQNKVLIYRGKEYERLQDFNARMQMLFPNAELMKTLTAPSEEIKASQKQYLQINAVTPVMEHHSKFRNKQVSEKILKYYNFNEVSMFTFSRRIDEGGSDITNIWQEKTNLITKSPLPGILCWFPVVQTDVYKVSPIETAIETLDATNKKLSTAIEQQITDPNIKIGTLGMLLNGVVDAAVQGGVSNWKHFYADDYGSTDKEKGFARQLKDLTKDQAVLLKDAMHIHKERVSDDLKPFHAHLEQRFTSWIKMIETEYNLQVREKIESHSTLKRFQSMSVVSLDKISLMSPSAPASAASTSNLTSPQLNNSPSVRTTPGAGRSASVWVRSDKGDKSVSPLAKTLQTKNTKKLYKRGSQISTASSSDSLDSSNRNSLETPIELHEQITPRRPPRPEGDKERRNSRPLSSQFPTQPQLPGCYSNSTPNISTTNSIFYTTETGDDETDDAPPPLPDKTTAHNHNEPPYVPPRSASMALPPKTPRKSKPLPAQPSTDSTDNGLPSLPDKHRTPSQSSSFDSQL